METETVPESEAARPGGGFRFNYEINLGHLLQATVVVIGLVSWAIASGNRAEQAQRDMGELKVSSQRDMGELKTSVTNQIKDMRSDLAHDLADIHNDMRGVAEMRARLDVVDRWIGGSDGRRAAIESRLNAVERNTIEIGAQLNAISQASQVKLPKR